MRVQALALVSFALMLVGAIDAQPRRVVGTVLAIAGPAYVRSATDGREIKLDPKKDVGRPLFEGETLRCGAGGQLRAQIVAEVRELPSTDPPLELSVPQELTSSQKTVLDALQSYGRPGGTRGASAVIYSPADSGVVRARTLQVQWVPRAGSNPLRMALETADGTELWSARNVAGRDGVLRTDLNAELRKVLLERSDTEPLSLIIRDASGTDARVSFWTMTERGEEQFAAQLQAWDSEHEPLLRAIGRAHIQNSMRLFNDAAAEYDAALNAAPDSTSLLRAAISAHGKTGNVLRVNELARRLRGGS